jgi:hypothetical protein
MRPIGAGLGCRPDDKYVSAVPLFHAFDLSACVLMPLTVCRAICGGEKLFAEARHTRFGIRTRAGGGQYNQVLTGDVSSQATVLKATGGRTFAVWH